MYKYDDDDDVYWRIDRCLQIFMWVVTKKRCSSLCDMFIIPPSLIVIIYWYIFYHIPWLEPKSNHTTTKEMYFSVSYRNYDDSKRMDFIMNVRMRFSKDFVNHHLNHSKIFLCVKINGFSLSLPNLSKKLKWVFLEGKNFEILIPE